MASASDDEPLSDLFSAWEPTRDPEPTAGGEVPPTLGAIALDRRPLSRSRTIPPTIDDLREDKLGFSLRLPSPSGDLGPPTAGPAPGVPDPHLPTVSRPRNGGTASATGKITFPGLGRTIAGFRLMSELGRGAFARVYLAEQADLGGRRVALKVSRPHGEEPRILAKLQHAHIVPIHSVHDDPKSGLRLLCMPYLGGANMAQVLDAAGAHLPAQATATGRSLMDALDAVGGPVAEAEAFSRSRPRSAVDRPPDARPVASEPPRSPSMVRSAIGRYLDRMPWRARPGPGGPSPTCGVETVQPARRFFRNASYLESTVWIVARLAEALEHAHARGLLHRDLKPSNVLIAADGTPMLLDFNLSADLRAGAGEDLPQVGGTLPYMAPEHLDAFDPGGSTPPEAVDERSDIYALCLILHEMITGQPPFPSPPANLPLRDQIRRMIAERNAGPPSAHAVNPSIPWSLDSILRKGLDPRPGRRYQKAADLADDLRRFLDDLPLRTAPETSPRERLAKWCRRHPRACSASTVGGLAALLIVACGALGVGIARNLEAAESRLRLDAFRGAFREAQVLLNTQSGPIQHLEPGIRKAQHALAMYDVGVTDDWVDSPKVRSLAIDERDALRRDVAELILHFTRGMEAQSERTRDADRRAVLENCLGWLRRAERYDPRPGQALFEQRAEFAAALGHLDAAEDDRRRARDLPPNSAHDFYLLGAKLLADGRQDEADQHLLRAVGLDPQAYWPWFLLGICQMERDRAVEALGSFNACIALVPRFAWGHLNRGLALARIGRLDEARMAYDAALAANPNYTEALLNRGLVLLELNEPAAAARDFGRAIDSGHREPGTLAARAEALARCGRTDEADREFAEALRVRPDDPTVLVARGFSLIDRDPARAQADLIRSLAIEPENTRAHLGLAHLDLRADLGAALGHLDRALSADPDFADARELRALLLARRGDRRSIPDVERLLRVPTPRRLFNAACALAMLDAARNGDDRRLGERAIECLRRALEGGFPVAEAARDEDLRGLRDLPGFPETLKAPNVSKDNR